MAKFSPGEGKKTQEDGRAKYIKDRQMRAEAAKLIRIGQEVVFNKKNYVVVSIDKDRFLVNLGSVVGGPAKEQVGVLSPIFQEGKQNNL